MTMRTNMLSDSAIFSARIYFAYSQFQVFDKAALPGHHWTQSHFDQGFARTERNVSFGTPLEFGHGAVLVHLGPYEGRDDHLRVIEVPFEVSSGEVVVGGPEEFPVKPERVFQLPKGHYRLAAAQTVTDEEHENIDLYFEKLAEPLTKSRILVAEGGLRAPTPLLESAEDP
jgi:Competence protein J (ComJ)